MPKTKIFLLMFHGFCETITIIRYTFSCFVIARRRFCQKFVRKSEEIRFFGVWIRASSLLVRFLFGFCVWVCRAFLRVLRDINLPVDVRISRKFLRHCMKWNCIWVDFLLFWRVDHIFQPLTECLSVFWGWFRLSCRAYCFTVRICCRTYLSGEIGMACQASKFALIGVFRAGVGSGTDIGLCRLKGGNFEA